MIAVVRGSWTWLAVAGSMALLLVAAAIVFPSPVKGQTSGVSIEFVNPSLMGSEGTPVISDSPTGKNDTYRLVAWSNSTASNVAVEFEWIPGPGDPISGARTIGTGQRVSTDTWELEWDVPVGPGGILENEEPQNPDSRLKVTLFDTTTNLEIDSDQIVVFMDHGNPTDASSGTAADLLYPTNGGPLGYYFSDTTDRSNSIIDVDTQGSTARTYYTTSLPGTEPEWRQCGSEGTAASGFPDGVRCSYPIDDPATAVNEGTLVPSVATGIAQSNTLGSSDAVRVFPYSQAPSKMTFRMFGQLPHGTLDTAAAGSRTKERDDSGQWPCSDWIRVTLVDQVDRRIAGANLDSHAQGPSDQLKYHTSYLTDQNNPAGSGPSYKTPDMGHSSGSTESGARCVSSHDTTPDQSEHGLGGLPDRKHIELANPGTRDTGTHDFRVRTDAPGVTQVAIYVDDIDDDVIDCTNEGDVIVGVSFRWGSGSVPLANPNEPTGCGTLPIETSATPTATATASQTASASSTPTSSASPGPTGDRTITMSPNKNRVRRGGSITFTGLIRADEIACAAGERVKLRAKRVGSSGRRFHTIALGQTNANGEYRIVVRTRYSKDYRAVAPATDLCDRTQSPARRVTVRNPQ